MTDKKRHYLYGLDALRMIGMVMIIITHILGKGGVKDSLVGNDPSYAYLTWGLQGLVYCAVNCYGLISGYVGVGSRFRLTKVVLLWLQVAFYTLGMTILFALMGYSISLQDWFDAIFPIINQEYWYMSAYFGLLFLSPILNAGLRSLSDYQTKYVMTLVILLFSILPAVLNTKVPAFTLAEGFGMNWLVMLYIIGACLKRFNLKRYGRFLPWFWVYLLSTGVTLAGLSWVGDIWYWYSSPSLLLASIALFMIFVNWNPKTNSPLIGWIRWFAPTNLGVYLIHLQHILVQYWWRDFAKDFIRLPQWAFVLAILMTALAVYLVCSIFEKGRILLFEKLAIANRLSRIDDLFPFENRLG